MRSKEKFTEIYNSALLEWGSIESVSGQGSELQHTIAIRKELPVLCEQYQIKTLLDIPCGDYNWMKSTKLNNIEYTGGDIVDDLILNNRRVYPDVNFEVLDIIEDELPKVDLVFVRDCLVHLSEEQVFNTLDNIKKSGSRYLLATSFPRQSTNINISTGNWRPMNLMIEPYFLRPIALINESCVVQYPQYDDKCMVLFDLNNLYSGGKNKK